ncbi:SDR family NAD(P)-dependent oxidoreductase [Hydrocarboniphaga sp.]|uniref:SDR family NAD(P)-dependent oxidoreductase n=1 Tax=Hydrocarboniphaga sp. TaxID=2033016 RepID=UPI003D148C48
MRLQGKVALVTGGTSGIGAATVRRLAAEGAQVMFTGRNAAAAEALCAATGARFRAHAVEDAPGWADLSRDIEHSFGRLDIAFANAGIEGGDTDIEKIGLQAWSKIVEVNLTGPMLTAQHAIALMKRNPGGSRGSIILNSSMNGILALGGNVGYSTTKGGLRLLAKSIAMHCANQGLNIRCNSIHPGVVETQLIKTAIAGAPDPALARKTLEGLAPMKRMATMEEIAGLVVYLSSDEAAFVTGAEYVIDGGSTAGMNGV